jgi:hypothetical protein
MSDFESKLEQLRAAKHQGRVQMFVEVDDCAKNRDHQSIIGVCGVLGNYALEEAMLMVSSSGQETECAHLLNQASNIFKDNLTSALAAQREFLIQNPDRQIFDSISIDALWYPICIHVLAGNFLLAKELADWVLKTPPMANNNRPESEFTALLAALLRKDVAAFAKAFQAIDEWPHDSVTLYIELGTFAQTVIEQNQVDFKHWCTTTDTRFQRRKRISEVGCYPASFGIGGYNQVYFDYISMVIGKIARWHGMPISIETKSFPKSLFDLTVA